MKRILAMSISTLILALALGGCTSSQRQDTYIAGGAAVGGLAGHALGGGAVGTVAGAVVGGVAGNELSK